MIRVLPTWALFVLLAAMSAFADPGDPVSISLAGAMLLAGR